MLTKLLPTKFLAFLTSIGLIAMIASEAYARVSHPIPEHISGHHHGPPVTSSSSVQEPEASPPASEHQYTGGRRTAERAMSARYLIALALIVAVTIVCRLEKSWIESEMHEPLFSGAHTSD